MAKKLRLKLLGELEITLDDVPVGGFDSNKAKALLCYLAVTGRTHFRPGLLGLLWGDMPEIQAKANLRVALSNLRKLLGPYLTITRRTVAFNRQSPHQLDVADFEAAFASPEPDLDRLRVAIELYQNNFLTDFHVREAPDFEGWVLSKRERLRELALQALGRLATHYIEQGDSGRPQAGHYTRRLLSLDPGREKAHRQLMLLLAREGQREAALAQYEVCRRVLRDKLGVEPAAETTALYERIRAAKPGHDRDFSPESNLLLGRERELAELQARLAGPHCQLLTILGPGGIGKTSLARRVLADQAGRFLEGGCLVPLAAVSSIDFLIPAIADTLQLSFHSDEKPAEQLLNYLRRREMLLVLDNFEHLLDGAHLLAGIMRQAPAVKLLVTSRERLNLRGEWLFELEGLTFPESEVTATLEDYSAVRLFLHHARRAQNGAILSKAETWAVVRICQLVQGMPLGIELAAPWIQKLSCQEIAGEIERGLGFLTASSPHLPARHRSLRAVFDHSWQLLPAEEKQVFRNLAVFQGDFERRAAERVAGASLLTLSGLVDKSFLSRNASGRYERHTLLWQYAKEKLAQFPEAAKKIEAAHCRYYATFFQQRALHLNRERQKEALAEIGAEIENVRAAWDWAITHRDFEAIEGSLPGLYRFYEIRSRFEEGESLFGRAAASLIEQSDPPKVKRKDAPLTSIPGMTRLPPSNSPHRGEDSLTSPSLGGIEGGLSTKTGGAAPLTEQTIIWGKLLSRQASFCELLGLYRKAGDHLQASLVIFRQASPETNQDLNPGWELGFCLHKLGIVARRLGEYGEEKRLLEESLQIFEEVGDPYEIASVLDDLGTLATRQGEYPQAKTRHLESLAIREEIGDKRGIAETLGELALAEEAFGEYEEAKQLFEKSLAIYKELGDQFGQARLLINLGTLTDVHPTWGDNAVAERFFRESLAISREIGARRATAYALGNLGAVIYLKGDHLAANTLLREALTICQALDHPSGVAACARFLGKMAYEMGDYATAQQYSRQALEIAVEIEETPAILGVLGEQAMLLVKAGEKAPAFALLVFLIDHPASDEETKADAAHLLTDLAAALPPDIVSAAEAKGKTMSLEAAVAAALAAMD